MYLIYSFFNLAYFYVDFVVEDFLQSVHVVDSHIRKKLDKI